MCASAPARGESRFDGDGLTVPARTRHCAGSVSPGFADNSGPHRVVASVLTSSSRHRRTSTSIPPPSPTPSSAGCFADDIDLHSPPRRSPRVFTERTTFHRLPTGTSVGPRDGRSCSAYQPERGCRGEAVRALYSGRTALTHHIGAGVMLPDISLLRAYFKRWSELMGSPSTGDKRRLERGPEACQSSAAGSPTSPEVRYRVDVTGASPPVRRILDIAIPAFRAAYREQIARLWWRTRRDDAMISACRRRCAVGLSTLSRHLELRMTLRVGIYPADRANTGNH